MTLTDICTSLQLSKELKSAGYPQKSLFWWSKNGDIFQPTEPENNQYALCAAPHRFRDWGEVWGTSYNRKNR